MTAAIDARVAYERCRSEADRSVVVSLVDAPALDAYETREADGELRGVPVLVKDNIALAGVPCAAGCPAFATGPAAASATVVERLEHAGAFVVGTANMDQFATGLVGTRSPHGTPRNPCAPDRIPGGSSSGSAVAVARGLVPFALGTDTAGSGRVPAACTNTVGVKPTRGLVSTRGIVPAVAGLDCVSVHALTVAGAFRVLGAIAGFDPCDPWSRYAVDARGPGAGFPRIGWVPDAELAASCETAVAHAYRETREVLRGLAAVAGAVVDLAPAFAAGSLLYGPYVAARYAAFGGFADAHPDAVDPTVARVVGAGRSVAATDLFAAQAALASHRRTVDDLFAHVDVVVVPTIPFLPTLDDVAADPLGMNARLGRFTDFVNLLDLCAVAVPGAPRADRLPFGVSVIGPAGADVLVADVAARLHAAVGGTLGVTGEPVPAEPWPDGLPGLGGPARVAVAGAHLRGLPLHHQLTAVGARLVRAARTAPRYRLYALAGTEPPKPGLVRDDRDGAAVEVEVYALSEAGFGRFVAGISAPLAIGPVELEDGATVPGFLATAPAGTLDAATDITHHGGWRGYVAHLEHRRTG